PELVGAALKQSIIKLDPRLMVRNPVMFTVEIGSFVMLLVTAYSYSVHDVQVGGFGYNLAIFLVLLITVLFANFAEALAEARGKAQAESLRKTREATPARKIFPVGEMYVDEIRVIPSSQLRMGDQFVCEMGDIIPMDGE